MKPTSLSQALEQFNEAFLFGQRLTVAERTALANWLAGRQGLPGSYAGMFAPLPDERVKGYTTLTGEVIASDAGARHVLGEEACTALWRLQVPAARAALEAATANFMERLNDAERRNYGLGTFCCGTCSCAYWRHLAAGGLDRQEQRLAAGMAVLKSRRLDTGRWRAFPLWYTLLALIEVDSAAARAEKQFVAPACERYVRRAPVGRHGERRRKVAERLLAQV